MGVSSLVGCLLGILGVGWLDLANCYLLLVACCAGPLEFAKFYLVESNRMKIICIVGMGWDRGDRVKQGGGVSACFGWSSVQQPPHAPELTLSRDDV